VVICGQVGRAISKRLPFAVQAYRARCVPFARTKDTSTTGGGAACIGMDGVTGGDAVRNGGAIRVGAGEVIADVPVEAEPAATAGDENGDCATSASSAARQPRFCERSDGAGGGGVAASAAEAAPGRTRPGRISGRSTDVGESLGLLTG